MLQIDSLDAYLHQAEQAITRVDSLDQLEQTALHYAGRKSQLAELSKSLRDLPEQQRAEAGQAVNRAKSALESWIVTKRQELLANARPRLDMSLPAIRPARGHLHPTTQTIAEIVDIFSHLGMSLVEAPEVDYDWYVFESLNMPVTHPARDDWETFFADLPADQQRGKPVLRPHTTNFELHVMEQQQPPIRAITIGKTYRRQADVSHTPMFHQFEGLVVDKGLAIGNLVATLEYFVHNFFGPQTKTRIRPYHFRFTEPSFELDISCSVCGGQGCKLCKEGWLELGGAGMTHPTVLKNAGLDPDQYSGYAWGFGVERCLAIRYGIDDLRLVYNNDLRFLEQF
jgi:phenylalanyl-tRNA synthetase alpha chain